MEKILNGVKNVKQEGYNLCWAACLEMMVGYHNPKKPTNQQDIVAQKFGLTNSNALFDNPTKRYKPKYDQAASADEIIKWAIEFNCSSKQITDKRRYWKTIKTEINENRPLIANLGFHYVVVVGYERNAEGLFFIYNDPKKDYPSRKKFIEVNHITIHDELLTINFNG